MQQQITRGDYLKDLITIFIENNLQQDVTELYDTFIFQCGEIQQFLAPAQVIKISLNEQESQKLKNTNVAYLAGITKDGHKETFNGSLSFNTRGEVVYYEPPVSTLVSSSTTAEATCVCRGLNGFFSNCTQPAIKAYFNLNYVPSKLSELINDTDFQDSVEVAESISIHNESTDAHTYIQDLIATEASLRASQTSALNGSIQAETTAREEAVSLAISTTEGYTDINISIHNSSTEAHPYIQSALASTTEAIEVEIGDLDNLDTSVKSSVVNSINSEVSARENADNNLQGQIDALSAASDVTDIVGTYQELQNYDTQHLNDNDIIKVLSDSTHDDQPSYYRFDKETDTFSYVGSESASYTKAQSDSIFVTQTTEINNHPLTSDINLTYSDVGALADTYATTIAANTSAIAANTSVIEQHTTAIAGNTSDISTINGKIPTDASSSNKLVTATALATATSTLANKDLSNLSTTGESRLHALKAYSDNGELLTDAEGLADVVKYAHSTFDRSKFTVVGSPNITDNGIASGFSNSNQVVSGQGAVAGKPLTVTCRFTTGADVTSFQLVFGYDGYIEFSISNSELTFKYNLIASNTLTVSSNTTYDAICIFTGTSTYYGLKQSSETNYTYVEAKSASALSADKTIKIGANWNSSYNFLGSIDLKQFSVTVDGVPVFSGNKTGIDTVKSDDYTVESTPTISADGIVTYFPYDGYLTKTISISKDSNFTIYGKFNYETLSTGQTLIGFVLTSSDRISLTAYNNKLNFAGSGVMGDTNLVGGNSYYYKANWTGSEWKIYLLINNEWHLEITDNANYSGGHVLVDSDIATVILGANLNYVSESNNRRWQGTQDLNAFKIYVDGDLVYQPCLKIPYTESKTGSKIVNSIYRDRVNDMAEQFGYANYYTLDEDNGNFTLPMGDVYGLIEKLSNRPDYDSTITISDINGSSKAYTIGAKCLGIIKPSTPDSTYTISVQPAYGSAYKSISGYGYMTLEFDTGDKVYASVASSMDVYLIR